MEPSDERELAQRANQLYWDSDESVNEIADELGLSKGALYGLVEPRLSGLPCPRCGTEMEYPNRTAREKGYLACPACDLEEDEAVVRSGGDPFDVPARSGTADSGEALNRLLLGSALLGAAAGVALMIWARRK